MEIWDQGRLNHPENLWVTYGRRAGPWMIYCNYIDLAIGHGVFSLQGVKSADRFRMYELRGHDQVDDGKPPEQALKKACTA